jgi:hypothetical protein
MTDLVRESSPVGFESSRMARRRLAALASSNEMVQEALAPASFPGFLGRPVVEAPPGLPGGRAHDDTGEGGSALARQLDSLARDILGTPGAGSALLAAYAAQARALSMVLEATRLGGDAPLPAAVVHAAREALTAPSPLAGLAPR